MPSMEERNVAALSLWHNEAFANRKVDLGPGLNPLSHVGTNPLGLSLTVWSQACGK